MIIAILDFISFLTMGLLTVPAWFSFFFSSLSGLFSTGTAQ